MTLAGGVEFKEDAHEYWYKGKKLSGITGMVSKQLGLRMPEEFVEEHRAEGVHIHKSVQNWITTGKPGSIHPGVVWILSQFKTKHGLHSEVLVSDFKRYASAVDIVQEAPDGTLQIYDIKKGVFKRDYVTWQLSIYKYLIESYTERTVSACFCIAVRDREFYDIFTKPFGAVEKLLYTAA